MNSEEIIRIASEVILAETSALSALRHTLDNTFTAVVSKLLGSRGRVVLTGVGKSGHIAKKIASTFASTGTPALFLHPTEASHGDLGMIQQDDTVIALSRSGESPELKDILIYCKQHLIPIVAITAMPRSTLAVASDFILQMPKLQEACPLGLAPTTSSIMMLALGDALAIACLEQKKFSKNDFKILHPAGKIGLDLLKVSDVMHRGDEVPLLETGASLSDSILEMTRCRFGCVGITDTSGNLVGIFTDGDLRRSLPHTNLSDLITNLMTRNPISLSLDTYLINAAEIFRSRRIPSLFICKEQRPVGILHLHDLLERGLV
jgi:arabinose-5-phosphate isomerase